MKTKIICVAVSLLTLSGCDTDTTGPEQHKRVWVMSDTDNLLFSLKESDGALSMIRTCDYSALYVGLHADIVVRWHGYPNAECYLVEKIQPLKDSK